MDDRSTRLAVSATSLKLLAAAVWYAGGTALLLKGGRLLAEATALQPGGIWPWLAAGGALFLGGLKAKLVFSRSCRANLDRIAALPRRRIWQFYTPGFFAALMLMILAGATLSRLAHGSYPLLIAVGTLDLALATGLFASSYIFWSHRGMVK